MGMAVKVSLTGSVTGHTCIAAQVRLKHSKEVVCLAMNDSLLAVGSQSHTTLVDPRKKTPVQDVESLDEGHGEETGPIIPSNTARHQPTRLGMSRSCIQFLTHIVSRD